VLFSGKMVIKENQKKYYLIILKYVHNHKLYLLVKIKQSNHALINPLNTLTLYSLPTLSFLVSKNEEKENEEIPDNIFCILGHLSRQSCKQKSRRLSKGWQSLTKTGMRCYRCLTWVSCFHYTFQEGHPLSFP